MPRPVPVIRPANADDLPALIGLVRMLFALEEDFSFDADKVRTGLAQILDEPRACLLAADADSELVGMCSGQLTVSTAEGGPAVLVEDVVVDRQWRGRGVGRLLIQGLEQWAADNKARRLQLLADRDNAPALGFYERLGWAGTNLICLRRVLPQGA